MKKILGSIFSIIILLSLASCGPEQGVTAQTQRGSDSASDPSKFEHTKCSGHTEIRPKVDVLFIVDNLVNANNPELKTVMGDMVEKLADHFDYRLIVTPLHTNQADQFYMAAFSPSDKMKNLVRISELKSKITNLRYDNDLGGNLENGAGRIKDSIEEFSSSSDSNFEAPLRREVNSVVVFFSNGRQTANISVEDAAYDIRLTVSSKLDPLLFRLIAVSTSSLNECQQDSNGYSGVFYLDLARQIYQDLAGENKPNNPPSEYQDAYSICQKSGSFEFTQMFDQINKDLEMIKIEHQYNFWPISTDQNANFNANKIFVSKVSADGKSVISLGADAVSYVGYLEDQNTRFAPTLGEPFSAHMLQLSGQGIVKYPECLLVQTEENPVYFGYVALDRAPDISTVVLEINGELIQEGTENGWSLHDNGNYKENFNIAISGPNDHTPNNSFPSYRNGYLLKLNGSAVYKSGSKIRFDYKPAPVN